MATAGCIEISGVVAVASVATASVAICGGANVMERFKPKRQDKVQERSRDLKAIPKKEKKTAGPQTAQLVSVTKNGRPLGSGEATFDGEVFEMAFAPANENMVGLGGMKVSLQQDNIVELTHAQQPARKISLEFTDAAEAEAWGEYIKSAASAISVDDAIRIKELRERNRMQQCVIKSLQQKQDVFEVMSERNEALEKHMEEVEKAIPSDDAHLPLIQKIDKQREEIEQFSLELKEKLVNLETRIAPDQFKYEHHVDMLNQRLELFEQQFGNLDVSELPQLGALKQQNQQLAMQVEQLNADKNQLTDTANYLSQQIEGIEFKGQSEEVFALRQGTETLNNYAVSLVQRLDAYERGEAVPVKAMPRPADLETASTIRSLEGQLQSLNQTQEALILGHQNKLAEYDASIQQHASQIKDSKQQLRFHEEQHGPLKQQLEAYKQQFMEQNRMAELLNQQKLEASNAAMAAPAVDTGVLDAEREQRLAAVQRAEAAEARIQSFELEFQKAVNQASEHRMMADREAQNAQAEAQRAQMLHMEKEQIQQQLQEHQAIAQHHEQVAMQLQQSPQFDSSQQQALAAQMEQDQQILQQLEQALREKDVQYEQMLAEMHQSKDQEINELVMTIQAKEQEVQALGGEVMLLKESRANIQQLEIEREQLTTAMEKEREMVIQYEAELRSMANQPKSISYEQEYKQLQAQLQGSQNEFMQAQQTIVDLEAAWAEQQKAVESALATPIVEPTSPTIVEPVITSPTIVEQVIEPAVTVLEPVSAPTVVEQLPFAVQKVVEPLPMSVPTLAIDSSTMSTGSSPTKQSTISYGGNLVSPLAAPVVAGGSINMPLAGLATNKSGGSMTMPIGQTKNAQVAKVSYGGQTQAAAYPVPATRFSAASTNQATRASPMRGPPIAASAGYSLPSATAGYSTRATTSMAPVRQAQAPVKLSGGLSGPGVPITPAGVPVVGFSSTAPAYGAGASAPSGIQYGARSRVAASPMTTSRRTFA